MLKQIGIVAYQSRFSSASMFRDDAITRRYATESVFELVMTFCYEFKQNVMISATDIDNLISSLYGFRISGKKSGKVGRPKKALKRIKMYHEYMIQANNDFKDFPIINEDETIVFDGSFIADSIDKFELKSNRNVSVFALETISEKVVNAYQSLSSFCVTFQKIDNKLTLVKSGVSFEQLLKLNDVKKTVKPIKDVKTVKTVKSKTAKKQAV